MALQENTKPGHFMLALARARAGYGSRRGNNLLGVDTFLATSRTYLGIAHSAAPRAAIVKQPEQSANTYRRLAKSLLLATGLGGMLAAPAFADAGCGDMDGRKAHYQQHMNKAEQHHQQLHEALKLSAEQEPGWQKLMAAEQPRRATAGMAPSEDWSKLTMPERAEKMLALSTARQAHMTEYVAALKGFYDSLNVEQKKVFEDMHASQRAGMRGKMPPKT